MDLFDRSLLAAYETLDLEPQPSAWVDLYREAVERELLSPDPTPRQLVDTMAEVLPDISGQMPAHVSELVNALAAEQVRYLAVRDRTVDAPPPPEPSLLDRLRAARDAREERRQDEIRRAAEQEARDHERVEALRHRRPDAHRVLDFVWQLAENGHASMTIGDIADHLGLDQPRVSGHVQELVEAGWVERAMFGSVRPARRRPQA